MDYTSSMTNEMNAEAPIQTNRIAVTTQDAQGRNHTEYVRSIPDDEIPARREAIRRLQPMGSVYSIKVTAER